MGVLKSFVQVLFIFHVVKCESNITKQCVNDYRNIANDKIVNIKQLCKEKQCIAKCCPEHKIFYYTPEELDCLTVDDIRNRTNKSDINVDYKKIDIYEIDPEGPGLRGKINFNLIDNFQFVKNKKMNNDACAARISKGPMSDFRIGVDGSLRLDRPNYYRRWKKWEFDEFCVDFVVTNSRKGIKGPFQTYRLIINSNNQLEDNTNIEIYSAATMLVSLFFLLLVLFVYGAIRELRNLVGIVLMAYVATLALTFLLQAIHKLLPSKTSTFCKWYSAINYTLTLSIFFWMNVMSLDIWWTFRGMFKSRPIHRRGELSKFIWYAAYAWGVPLLVSVVVVVIDNVDLSAYPDIYQPHFELCLAMMYEQPEMKYYMYMPCLALILLNWMFFLMTAFNIWRIRKNMSKFSNESVKYKNNQNRFGLYLKLALVMGMSWLLEIIDLPRWLEKTMMFYNNLTGVAIFFIFVFKRKILLMLCRRFSVKGKLVDSLQRKYSNYSTTTASKNDRKQDSADLNSISKAPSPKTIRETTDVLQKRVQPNPKNIV